MGCDFVPGFAADAEGFEPTTSASGGRSTLAFTSEKAVIRDRAKGPNGMVLVGLGWEFGMGLDDTRVRRFQSSYANRTLRGRLELRGFNRDGGTRDDPRLERVAD